ncbi:MAG: 2-octaprenyl-6-methoxyphenyl hydroxylase [Pseudomonadota bacterium]
MASETDFDIAIVGGGLVGAALAVALSKSYERHRIALIEQHAIARSDASAHYDDRSVAIAHGTRLIFAQIGLDDIFSERCTPIKKIHVSQRGRFGATRMCAAEEHVPALGYVVENRVLGSALFECIYTQSNVTVLDKRQVNAANDTGASVELQLTNTDVNENISTRLLVAADGADSPLRERAGIKAREHDYGQSAVIANISVENGHDNTAYERFTDSGPLALLPLNDDRCSLVLTVKTEQREAVMQLDDDAFIEFVQTRFGRRMGAFTKVGQRSAFDLRRVTAEKSGSGRLLLLGNARHFLHPVAGQGFNLAMRDVATLAEVLADHAALEYPADVIASIDSQRRTDHNKLDSVTDALARLFTIPFAPLSHARSGALVATDLIPFVRHDLARHAMGLKNRLANIRAVG